MKRSAVFTARARELRRDPTPAELRLWDLLRSARLAGFKFRRRHHVEPYITDFCCLSARLVVELDGDSHAGKECPDEVRTADLWRKGYEVVRFRNSDVFHEENRVIETILGLCRLRAGCGQSAPGRPSPPPLSPEGRGEPR